MRAGEGEGGVRQVWNAEVDEARVDLKRKMGKVDERRKREREVASR